MFKYVINLGIEPGLAYVEKIQIQTLNKGVIFVILGVLARVVASGVNDENGTWHLVAFALLAANSLLLNGFKKQMLAKLNATVVLPVYLTYLFHVLGTGAVLEYCYFAFVLAILFLYEKILLIIANIAIIFALLIKIILYTAENVPKYSSEVTYFDTIINGCIVVLVISMGLYNFVKGVRHQEGVLREQAGVLAVKNKELNEANSKNQANNELLSILAHDLRGPANAFRKLTEKLGYLIKNEDHKELLSLGNYFEKSAGLLFFNLDNLLVWTVAQKGRLLAVPVRFNVKVEVDNVAMSLRYLGEAKNVSILNLVDESLELTTDVNMFNTIIHNLVHNAVKHAPSGSQIQIASVYTAEGLVVSVIDAGLGMTIELMYLLNGKNAIQQEIKAEGYGLGLQICLDLASRIQAGIEFSYSTDNKGLRVDLLFRHK